MDNDTKVSIEKRIQALEVERQKGEIAIDRYTTQLHRISGAIQVLKELITEKEPTKKE